MKFYLIPPNKHLELMELGNAGYFCLAHHYINDKNYKKHFLNIRETNPNAFITLDNGAAEDSLVTRKELIKIVKELRPSEVIAPDVLFNKEQTLMNFESFIEKMLERDLLSQTKLFACPQGSTKDEWLECYWQMVSNQHVSCIGLSKIAVPKCWNEAVGDTMIGKSRNQCVAELLQRGLVVKPFHLLGMGEHDEFELYKTMNIKEIRSSDSCYTVLSAINGIRFDSGDTTRIPTTNSYFDTILTDEQISIASSNINYLKEKYGTTKNVTHSFLH
jgi:hypothetical protein